MPTKTFTQFRVDNVVTTLPTTLSYGEEVYYKDSNGNLTLWVGHEDGTAWPSVGYKEYVALLNQADANPPVATIKIDTIGLSGAVFARTQDGLYSITDAKLADVDNVRYIINTNTAIEDVESLLLVSKVASTVINLLSFVDGIQTDGALFNTPFSIRIYP